MSAERREGLLHKYDVRRADDPAGKHDACRYFMLDPQHDPLAVGALRTYADHARTAGYVPLADDLEAWVGGHVRTVPCDSDVAMTATAPLRHLCPHVDEINNGDITITWHVDGRTLELHALADYLRSWKDAQLSHEEITDRIGHDISAVDGVKLVSVVTTWDTAGMEVRCSTSPTLADQR